MTIAIHPNLFAIRKWVDTLRSGKYQQTKGYLRKAPINKDGDPIEEKVGYCCLGVACDISGKGEWGDEPDRENGSRVYAYQDISDKVDGSEWSETQLTEAVAEWLGVDIEPYVHDHEDQRRPLATLNDEGLTFTEIADLIEKEWLS